MRKERCCGLRNVRSLQSWCHMLMLPATNSRPCSSSKSHSLVLALQSTNQINFLTQLLASLELFLTRLDPTLHASLSPERLSVTQLPRLDMAAKWICRNFVINAEPRWWCQVELLPNHFKLLLSRTFFSASRAFPRDKSRIHSTPASLLSTHVHRTINHISFRIFSRARCQKLQKFPIERLKHGLHLDA